MGAFDGAFKNGGSMSKIGNAISGTSSDAGFLGLGQNKAKGAEIDETAFTDTKKSDAKQAELAAALTASGGRKATPITAAKIAVTPEAQAAQLGAMNQVTGQNINTTQTDEVRAQQMGLAQALQQQAAGQGPTIAQTQLKQATDRNIAQAMALAASQRGGSAGGLGLRQINQQTAAINQQAGNESAILRAQEQMAARQQLAGVLEGTRATDAGLATNQAGLLQQAGLANQAALNQGVLQQGAFDQQAGMANTEIAAQRNLQQASLDQQAGIAQTQAGLQQQQLNDAMAQFYQGQSIGLDQADQNRLVALQGLKVNQAVNLAAVNQKGYDSASIARGGFAGGIGKSLASSAMSALGAGGGGGGGGLGGAGGAGNGAAGGGDLYGGNGSGYTAENGGEVISDAPPVQGQGSSFGGGEDWQNSYALAGPNNNLALQQALASRYGRV